MKGTDVFNRRINGFGRESSLPKLLPELMLGPVRNSQKPKGLLLCLSDDLSLDVRRITQ